MTTSQFPSPVQDAEAAGGCPVPHRSLIDAAGRVPLYTADFVADPHAAYEQMRHRFGGLVPVDLSPGVPATLVIDYQTAVRILNDPAHFSADPRSWQDTMPEDCPVRPMMAWLPAARNNDGLVHERYRKASVAAIDAIDTLDLPSTVETIAVGLINTFCRDGAADLVGQYAFPLVLEVLNRMVGCPADIGQRVATGMTMRFDTVRAAEGMMILKDALMQLITLRRAEPGDDVTSRLAQHSAELDDVEIFAQLMSFYGAGFEAQRNLLTNAVLLMITDARFRFGEVLTNLTTRDALDEVLFDDPPISNFCTTYPRQPMTIDGVWLPPQQPVVISLTACNNDPAIRGDIPGGSVGNRSHLAWSTGPHACPAKDVAYGTVHYAIDQLFDALPDMRLACRRQELTWRPGPFHRAMTRFPVVFTPTPPMHIS